MSNEGADAHQVDDGDNMRFQSQPQSINQSSDEGSGSHASSMEETPSVHTPEPEYGVDEEGDIASLYAGRENPGHIVVLFHDIKVIFYSHDNLRKIIDLKISKNLKRGSMLVSSS